MMAKKYRVHLTEAEQEELKRLVSKGRAAAYRQTHARILLLSDESQAAGAMKDEEIAQGLEGRRRHSGTGAPEVRGRGLGTGLGTQGTVEPSPEEAGRSGGGPLGGLGLLPTTRGPDQLDAASAG